MTNRRSFILALTAAALTPTVTYAAEAGDIFGNILQGIKDRKEREWYEKHRDEGRWDGKYYYDRKTNKRYSRDAWRKELSRRHQEDKRRGVRPGKPEPRRDRDDRKNPPRRKPDPRKGPDRRDDRRDHRPGR